MDVADDLRSREHQQVVVALEVDRMVREALATELRFA